MTKTKLNLTLPLPLYRGIVAEEGMNAGKMVHGSVLINTVSVEPDISIAPKDIDEAFTIRPETLGMYIGKEDINGKKIFTGDVLEDKCDDNLTKYFLVVYSKENFRFALCSSLSSATSLWHISKYISLNKIIGNIHENPELLKLFPHLQAVNA